MSQILRALSLGRRPRGGDGGRAERDDDAVLAGLGVRSSQQQPPRVINRTVVFVLLSVVVLAGSIFAVNVLLNRAAAIAPGGSGASDGLPRVGREQPGPVDKGPEPQRAAQTVPVAQSVPEPESSTPGPVTRTAPPAAAESAPVPERTPIRSNVPRASSTLAVVPPEPGVTPPATPPASGVDHFKLAVYYQQTGDFENALSHWGILLQRDPLNAEAHNNLGLLYKQHKLVDKAITEFEKALSINPKYAVARNNLAVTFLEAGRAEAAATQLRAIVASDPDNVDALVNLSLALSAMKQDGAAQQTLMKAIGIEPRHAAAHFNLARMYEEERENAKALERYRSFLQYAGPEHTALIPEVSRRVAALEKKQGG